MNVLAIIPARGGSKGIPRKNLRPVGGRALVAWSIEAALNAEMVDRVVVSTEDEEIARVARGWGAEAIQRPDILATDAATTDSVIAHALTALDDWRPDLIVLLQPTAPVRAPGLVDACIRRLLEAKADSLLTANRLHFVWWRGQRVLFQTEAGPTVGYGHAIRTLAVAQECARQGAVVSVAVADPMARGLVRTAGVRLAVPADEDLTGIIVRDFRTGWPQAPGPRIPAVDMVDETEDASGAAELTFAMLGAPMDGARVGTDYAAIRSEFRHAERQGGGGVLVALGGADPTGSVERLCHGLTALAIPCRPVGRFPSNGVPIWESLSLATVAVTSGGMMMFEAASLGVPVLAVANNERERGRLLRLKDAGHRWFRYLGMAAEVRAEDIRRTIADLGAAELDRMGKEGSMRVDGLGAPRIAKAILDRAVMWRTQSSERPMRQAMTDRDLMWHEDGSVFVVTRSHFEAFGRRVGGRVEVYETPRTVDIDTESDLSIVEAMLIRQSAMAGA